MSLLDAAALVTWSGMVAAYGSAEVHAIYALGILYSSRGVCQEHSFLAADMHLVPHYCSGHVGGGHVRCCSGWERASSHLQIDVPRIKAPI